jgi:hypothetical protein
MKKKIFISWSMSIKKLSNTDKKVLDQLIHQWHDVIIWDCYWIDTLVQEYLKSKWYERVVVYHIGEQPRNNKWFYSKKIDCQWLKGRKWQTKKDEAMTNDCDSALVIFDWISQGSRRNIIRTINSLKRVNVIKEWKLFSKECFLYFIEHEEIRRTCDCWECWGETERDCYCRVFPAIKEKISQKWEQFIRDNY